MLLLGLLTLRMGFVVAEAVNGKNKSFFCLERLNICAAGGRLSLSTFAFIGIKGDKLSCQLFVRK